MTMTAKQLIAAAAACADCGKEHEYRKIGSVQCTWAAKEGHPYRPRLHMMTNISAGPVLNALRQIAEGLTMETVPVRLPDDAKPGAVVELYTAPDGTMAAEVRIPAHQND